jgi:DNA-binding CsgD family transcriptional regulator
MGHANCRSTRGHARLKEHDFGPVDLLGRYSNPDNVARIRHVLAGQGRDGPSHRPVPSVKQKQTRLTDSAQIEVLERYRAGETANTLADAFDVNRATVFAILQRAGIKSRYRILTDRDVGAASAMYDAGQSLASIAKHFGVADRTVLNAFRRVGVPTRARGTNQWSQPAASPTPR